MLNLLIALMGDSFSKVRAKGHGQWRYEQATTILEQRFRIADFIEVVNARSPYLHVLQYSDDYERVVTGVGGAEESIHSRISRHVALIREGMNKHQLATPRHDNRGKDYRHNDNAGSDALLSVGNRNPERSVLKSSYIVLAPQLMNLPNEDKQKNQTVSFSTNTTTTTANISALDPGSNNRLHVDKNIPSSSTVVAATSTKTQSLSSTVIDDNATNRPDISKNNSNTTNDNSSVISEIDMKNSNYAQLASSVSALDQRVDHLTDKVNGLDEKLDKILLALTFRKASIHLAPLAEKEKGPDPPQEYYYI